MQSKFYSFYIAFIWIDTGLAQNADYCLVVGISFHIIFFQGQNISVISGLKKKHKTRGKVCQYNYSGLILKGFKTYFRQIHIMSVLFW